MVSLFLLLGCNLSYIVDLFAALHELASASALTLLKLASSVRALLKPYGDTLSVDNTSTGYITLKWVALTQHLLYYVQQLLHVKISDILFLKIFGTLFVSFRTNFRQHIWTMIKRSYSKLTPSLD